MVLVLPIVLPTKFVYYLLWVVKSVKSLRLSKKFDMLKPPCILILVWCKRSLAMKSRRLIGSLSCSHSILLHFLERISSHYINHLSRDLLTFEACYTLFNHQINATTNSTSVNVLERRWRPHSAITPIACPVWVTHPLWSLESPINSLPTRLTLWQHPVLGPAAIPWKLCIKRWTPTATATTEPTTMVS